jgi:GNAT superfamily N-acetyltransferase
VAGGFAVRLARDDELDAAGDVVAGAYRPMPGMDEDGGYLEHVRDARGRSREVDVLVAVDEAGRMLGCASFVRDHTSPFAELERPDEAGIRMVGVAADSRGRGVGRALVEACAERARASGKRGLAILTDPRWTVAHAVYERLGFRRAPDRDWEPEPGFLLWAWTLAL